MSCARILVTGRVQGVFFRQFTLTCARRLGLRGWVRNLPDRRVEAEVVGERGQIEDLINQLRGGPPGSEVTGLETKWQAEDPEHSNFAVRYS